VSNARGKVIGGEAYPTNHPSDTLSPVFEAALVDLFQYPDDVSSSYARGFVFCVHSPIIVRSRILPDGIGSGGLEIGTKAQGDPEQYLIRPVGTDFSTSTHVIHRDSPEGRIRMEILGILKDVIFSKGHSGSGEESETYANMKSKGKRTYSSPPSAPFKSPRAFVTSAR
jgi:hypothetical protein